MKQIERDIKSVVFKKLQPNKVIVITGARRTGKTFLIKDIIKKVDESFILLNGEDMGVWDSLARRSAENYSFLLGNSKLLIIDEAQKIPDIGNALKLMIDEIAGLKIIITGSSAFDLSNFTGEPLTGRSYSIPLFPLSESEFIQVENKFMKGEMLRNRLVFGNYPELIHFNNRQDTESYLNNLVNTYLLKDILAFENLKNSSKIIQLLRLIAYQIGHEVSYEELGRSLSMSKNTVEKYLQLLSKVFILHQVTGFSRNLRKEITKSSRWYFVDNGIRNTIIANFNALEIRNDVGMLWENYIISERIKYQSLIGMTVNNYFWRTYDRQEIDWVEDRGGRLFAYEFKWKNKKVRPPVAWAKAYPDSEFDVINPDNYQQWLSSGRNPID